MDIIRSNHRSHHDTIAFCQILIGFNHSKPKCGEFSDKKEVQMTHEAKLDYAQQARNEITTRIKMTDQIVEDFKYGVEGTKTLFWEPMSWFIFYIMVLIGLIAIVIQGFGEFAANIGIPQILDNLNLVTYTVYAIIAITKRLPRRYRFVNRSIRQSHPG
jgi:hypothetical protein